MSETTTETTITEVSAPTDLYVPTKPAKSFRVIINLNYRSERMDTVLIEALRNQSENATLKIISRGALKELFTKGKIEIKGQRAKSNSAINKGITYVDILGF